MNQSVRNLDKTQPIVLNFMLTKQEAAILDAAAHVKFGELLEIEIQPGDREVERELAPPQVGFVQTLRTEELSYLDAIVVHNGLPVQIEIDGQFEGIKYRRKIRFS